jgi:hypothetical protein
MINLQKLSRDQEPEAQKFETALLPASAASFKLTR